MLLYIMLYIVLAYLMLFSALTNAVCLHNASFVAIDFCKCYCKRYLIYIILTGLVLSSNVICLNTQLAVKVNIFSFANFGVLKL